MFQGQGKGKIFIDGCAMTAARLRLRPSSIRARKGAPVAVPVTWQKLARLRQANGFSILSKAVQRLEQPVRLQ